MKNMKGFCFFLLFVCNFLNFILLGCFLAGSSVKSPQALGLESHSSSHQWDRVMAREAAPALQSLLGGCALLTGARGSKRYILSLKSADLRMNMQICRKLLVLRAPLMCDHTLT